MEDNNKKEESKPHRHETWLTDHEWGQYKACCEAMSKGKRRKKLPKQVTAQLIRRFIKKQQKKRAKKLLDEIRRS